MKKISMKKLFEMALAAEVPLYVRWSFSTSGDIKRGYSTNHATGVPEAGLSCNPLPTKEITLTTVGKAVHEYSTLAYYGARPYVLTGRKVGTGSDGEPLLADVEWIAAIDIKDAMVDYFLVDHAEGVRRLYSRGDIEGARGWYRDGLRKFWLPQEHQQMDALLSDILPALLGGN